MLNFLRRFGPPGLIQKARERPGGQKDYLKHSLEILGQGTMITVHGDGTDAVGSYAGGCAPARAPAPPARIRRRPGCVRTP